MKAITFDDFGAADVLRLAQVPMPEVRPSDLLVRVHAAGVNRADLLQRQGYYGRQSYGESDLLGLEVAGEVIAVGSDVTGIDPSQRVMAIVGGGAYAEFAHVDRGMAVPIPTSLDFVGAAAVMESFVTAWEAAVHLGGTASGTAVLIHAAAGGVGSAAVAIANAVGARVFATANAERRADVLALGAEAVFDYQAEDFEQGVRERLAQRTCPTALMFAFGPRRRQINDRDGTQSGHLGRPIEGPGQFRRRTFIGDMSASRLMFPKADYLLPAPIAPFPS